MQVTQNNRSSRSSLLSVSGQRMLHPSCGETRMPAEKYCIGPTTRILFQMTSAGYDFGPTLRSRVRGRDVSCMARRTEISWDLAMKLAGIARSLQLQLDTSAVRSRTHWTHRTMMRHPAGCSWGGATGRHGTKRTACTGGDMGAPQ